MVAAALVCLYSLRGLLLEPLMVAGLPVPACSRVPRAGPWCCLWWYLCCCWYSAAAAETDA